MTSQGPVAPVAECRRCGAPLEVDPRDSTAHCSACGADATDFVVERGPSYGSAIEDERLVERFERARAEYYARERPPATSSFWLLALAFFAFYWVLELSLGVARGGAIDFAVLAASVLVVNRSVLRLLPDRSRAGELEPETPMSVMTQCAACGAGVLFRDEAAEAKCPFCGAIVVEPSEIERSRLDRAKRRTFEATREAESEEHGGPADLDPGALLSAGAVVLVAALLALVAYQLVGGVALTARQLVFGLMVAAVVGVGTAKLLPRSW